MAADTISASALMRASMRRARSALLIVPPSPKGSEASEIEEATPPAQFRYGRIAMYIVGAAFALWSIPFVLRYLGRLGWLLVLLGANVLLRLAAPEAIGFIVSKLVSKLALYGEVELSFTGVRIIPWIELGQSRKSEGSQPLIARPRARFIDADGNEVEASFSSFRRSLFGSGLLAMHGPARGQTMDFARQSPASKSLPREIDRQAESTEAESSFETLSAFSKSDDSSTEDASAMSGCIWSIAQNTGVPLWRRFIEHARFCIEIRCKKFSMGNPHHTADWCHNRFVTGTDIDVTLSTTLSDLFQLLYLTRYWSWRPRDQPVRLRDDGGGLPFGAVRDAQTHTLRNRIMLGVIDIEKFDLCDAEVAFEQCEGQLNSAALGTALARGEIKFAAWKGCKAARILRDNKLNRLRVDVLAARDLDKAIKAPRRGIRIARHGAVNAPSTFARIQARSQTRRSRTIMLNTAPVYGYEPEPFVVTDPSTVIHITVFDEARFGDTIVGQFATTLKQLVLDPHAVDGGLGLDIADVDGSHNSDGAHDGSAGGKGTAYLERRGWVPLRDAKWRPFDVPRFQLPDRTCGARINFGTGNEREDEIHDSALREQPLQGYPALMIKLRWERSEDIADVDETGMLTALEHMKLNSAETAARCGSLDHIRAMLASFPFWFDWRGGFKIRGRATAHVRDLFLGNEGALERRRRRRPNRQLTNADWRDARRKAITISRIEVAFPLAPDERNHRYNYVWSPQRRAMIASVEERRGFLTLETAFIRLVKGLVERVWASGRVSAALGHIVSAVTYGTFVAHTPQLAVDDADTERKALSTFELAKKTARASLVPYGALRGYRSDRQFALMLGFVKKSHKRMDARAIEDVTKPVRAAGILMKTSKPPGGHRRWKPYRCVLRGATIFYFEIGAAGGPKSGVRRGEDHVIDLHRVVVALDAEPIPTDEDNAASLGYETVLVKLGCDADQPEIELGIRADDGRLHSKFLALPKQLSTPETTDAIGQNGSTVALDNPAMVHEVDDPEKVPFSGAQGSVHPIEAVGWDEAAYTSMRLSLTKSLRDWRDAIVSAIITERQGAQEEVRQIVREYHRHQEKILIRLDHLGEEKRSDEQLEDQAVDGQSIPADADDINNPDGTNRAAKRQANHRNETGHWQKPTARVVEEEFMDENPIVVQQCCAVGTMPSAEGFPVNGAWNLVKRGRGLDALLEAEGVSYGARMLLSSAAATLWIRVEKTGRATIHMRDGFLGHRFVGKVGSTVRTKKITNFGQVRHSPIVLDKVLSSEDGRWLKLTQSSPLTGNDFYMVVWTVQGNGLLEQRTRWLHADLQKYGTLFNESENDMYERATGDQAERIEIAAGG